ncbi:MAG: hypothetical protein ACOYKJ_02970 [Candidatus Howiella sp.]|jgi:hypothetical protein
MNFKLYALLEEAKTDSSLRKRLLHCKSAADPATAFCEACGAAGAEISVGELLASGEAFCSNLHKSVNGGATDPLDGWADELELIFASLEAFERS